MKILGRLRESNRYTVYGALFGALFPLFSWLIITFVSRQLSFLFGVICTAPFFLGLFARFAGVRQDRINAINRGLEEQVGERTRSMKGLLDASGQGFLSFDRRYIVGPEYSRACEVIFGRGIAGSRIDELLYPGSAAGREFTSGLDLFFSGSAQPEVIFDLLDHELFIGAQTVRVEYKAVSPERVMAVLTDVTEERALQDQVRGENERRALLLKVITNRESFGAFVRHAQGLLAALERGPAGYESILGELHTLKGNAGFHGFQKSGEAAHELESYLSDCLNLGERIDLDGHLAPLQGAFAEELAVVSDTLGQDWIRQSDSIVIPREEYARLEGLVRSSHPADSGLIAALEGFRTKPLSSLFARFPQMVQNIAAQRGKRVAPVVVMGGSRLVVPEEYEQLVGSFVHIARNMVDHGIEPPAERESAGKSPEGRIRIDIRDSDREVAFRFSDDGRGIRLEEIERKARQMGLIAEKERPAPAQLLELIFSDGFSTARSVTTLSGRGVGLSAVRRAVRQKGGSISVATRAGRGSTFTVTVPLRAAPRSIA